MLRQVMLLSRERTTASTYMAADTHLSTIHTAYLDTVGGTAQITYGFKLFCQDNNTTTIYLNRMVSSYDYVWIQKFIYDTSNGDSSIMGLTKAQAQWIS